MIKKRYYSIREVAEKTGVEAHVLRYWEKEFSMLRPKRGRSGNRFYRERDLKIILAIKQLRHDEKYTIQGALDRLKQEPALWQELSLETELDMTQSANTSQPPDQDVVLSELREMLVDLKKLIHNGESNS